MICDKSVYYYFYQWTRNLCSDKNIIHVHRVGTEWGVWGVHIAYRRAGKNISHEAKNQKLSIKNSFIFKIHLNICNIYHKIFCAPTGRKWIKFSPYKGIKKFPIYSTCVKIWALFKNIINENSEIWHIAWKIGAGPWGMDQLHMVRGLRRTILCPCMKNIL